MTPSYIRKHSGPSFLHRQPYFDADCCTGMYFDDTNLPFLSGLTTTLVAILIYVVQITLLSKLVTGTVHRSIYTAHRYQHTSLLLIKLRYIYTKGNTSIFT